MEMLMMIPVFKGDREELEFFLLVGDIIFQSFTPPALVPLIFIAIVKAKIQADCKGAITGLDNWPAIKAELQSSILFQSRFVLSQQMTTTKQGRNQSAKDYGYKMEQILADLIAATRATKPQEEHHLFETSYRTQALKCFIWGLNDQLKNWVRSHAPATLGEARKIATIEEQMLMPVSMQGNHSAKTGQPSRRRRRGKFSCSYCNGPGHTINECQLRADDAVAWNG